MAEQEVVEIEETDELESSEETEVEEVEQDEEASEESEAEESEETDETEESEEEEGDVVISIDGESPAPEEDRSAPEWVKDVRKQNRELKRRVKELEKQNVVETAQTVELGPKPKIGDDGIDYDESKHEAALDEWYEKKREVDTQKAEAQAQEEQKQKQWQGVLDSYEEKKTALKANDYEYAEDNVKEVLSVTQQGIILQGADNPAAMVYALGTNPKKAEELASIKDPVKFAVAMAKLETGMKVTRRKAATKPEKKVNGIGSVAGSTDKQLEKLEAQAEKTGDRSKVLAYKRKLKKK